ncbi:hypothetical protein B0919_03100 [Hymenobacter sp. CRA2]|nr:hypothetical protein B0919_03100 [Hymenobacter sp. CRA2]
MRPLAAQAARWALPLLVAGLTTISVQAQTPAASDTAFQRGSRVPLPKLNARQTESLALLGKVWGFAKYYHPAVAAGKYNWDAELFRVMPQVLAAPGTKARNAVLSAWLTSLGAVPACADCAKASAQPVHQQPDLAWLTDKKLLGAALSQQLVHLRDNRHQGAGYYIKQGGAGNPDFTHEAGYGHMTSPDAGYRLLALFRYWNMVQYFFPDKYLIGEDWNKVLPEFVPRFAQAATAEQYRLAVLELVARIHDTHGVVSEKDAGIRRIWGDYVSPVLVCWVQEQPVVAKISLTTFGVQTPLQKGDVVTRVDGVPVASIIKRWRPLFSASNDMALMTLICQNLLRGNTAQAQIDVLRAGNPLQLSVTRYLPDAIAAAPLAVASTDSSYRILPANIGYIHMGRLLPSQVARTMQALKDTKGIVIDLRAYPNFNTFRLLPGYFLQQAAPFAKFTEPDLSFPGRFVQSAVVSVTPNPSQFYTGKVAVLVNEDTRSLGEYTTMALQLNPRATVLGSTTAGADGNVSPIVLPGDLTTRFSGLAVFYPDGRETQRVGIIPTVKVAPSVEGVRAKRDEVLEKAVALLSQ